MNLEEVILSVSLCKGKLLYEERGVGATPDWLSTIKEVTDYVASKVKYDSPGFDGKWHISIPHSITSKFEIFNELNLNVVVEDKGEEAKYNSGGGEVDTFKYPGKNLKGLYLRLGSREKPNLDNPPIRYKSVDLTVYAFSNGDELIRKTVSYSLLHELNHKVDEYSRTLHNNRWKAGNVYNQTNAYLEYKKLFGDTKLYQVIYRLFSESEQNALISSLYSELEDMQSVRESFREDLHHTHTYIIYKRMKEIIESLDWMLDSTWEKLKVFCNVYKILSPLPNRDLNKVSLSYFKNSFIRKANKELEVLLKGMGRVASYYYDVQGDNDMVLKME